MNSRRTEGLGPHIWGNLHAERRNTHAYMSYTSDYVDRALKRNEKE